MRLRNAVTGVAVSVADDHPIVSDAEWVEDNGDESGDRMPDKSWKVDELREVATARGIDVDGLKKDEILAALAAGGESDEDDDESDEDDES